MKIFCVTGSLDSDLNLVASILASAGVAPPQSAAGENALTLKSWHERILAASNDEPLQAVHQPGKFWEQVASNLFIDSIRQPLWGWADKRSIWLLDFWQQFEPNLHFVLVYTSPHRVLATALSEGFANDSDIGTLMADWQAHNQEMLRFHHRNPKRTILVDASDCSANPQALIDACAVRWKINLKATANDTAVHAAADRLPLVSYLAAQLRHTQPQVQALQHELEASLQPLEADPVREHELALFEAVDEYRALSQAAREAAVKCATLEVERTGLGEKLAAANAEQSQLSDKLARAALEIEHRKKTESEHRATISALTSAGDTTRKENQLLLAQLHQVQEELEKLFLSSQELVEKEAEKRKTIDGLTAQVAGYEVASAALQNEQAKLAKEKVVQGESHKKELIELKSMHAADLQKAQNAAAAAKQDLAAQQLKLDKLRKELDAATRAGNDVQQENDLMLVQLHQVQEELEHYFHEHKAVLKEKQEQGDRWQRMLERNPDYRDYNSIQMTSIDQAAHRASWRINELTAAGRSFDEVRFDTMIEDGIARFAVNAIAKGRPVAFDTSGDLDAALRGMSAAEWSLQETLCHVIADELAGAGSTGDARRAIETAAADVLMEAIANLQQSMADAPATLRFDALALRREQVNPDYEHLWLQLDNLNLGKKRWPSFEFRISCANVRPGKFGGHPKLEFPSGAALFDSWFPEAYDDFGDKLELRFALPDAMDLGVWQALSKHDQDALKELIAMLPLLLTQLEQDGTRLARSFDHWRELAANVARIVETRTAPAPTLSATMPDIRAELLPQPISVPTGKKASARKDLRMAK